jgi:hypothetical protein
VDFTSYKKIFVPNKHKYSETFIIINTLIFIMYADTVIITMSIYSNQHIDFNIIINVIMIAYSPVILVKNHAQPGQNCNTISFA